MSIRAKPQIDVSEYAVKLDDRRQTDDGKEIPSDKPMAPPIGFVRQPSMVEHMRAMVRSELLRQAVEAEGLETFEEADDFDCPDELEPQSGYENDAQFEPPAIREAYKRESAEAAAKLAAKRSSTGVPLPGEGEGARGRPMPTDDAVRAHLEDHNVLPSVPAKPAPGPT